MGTTRSTIGDLSMSELIEVIERIVARRVRARSRSTDPRSLQEIFDSINRNRLPLGTKSTLELLREDRDR